MNELIVLAGNTISQNGLEARRSCLPVSPCLHPLHASELVVIDGRVPDIDTLRAGLRTDALLLILEEGSDGVRQIADFISANGLFALTAIQIVSHGASGALYLGATTLARGNLLNYAACLDAIGKALTWNGEILLYGCHVGEGERGRAFLSAVSELTGDARVAAASHLVGAPSRGGSWDLDVSDAPIVAHNPFHASALAAYRGTLTITGQLWYTTIDLGSNQLAGYFNSDGTSITQVGSTGDTALAIAVDTAAGYYFVANADGTSISSYRISDNSLIGTVQIGDSSLGELVNAIAVDPVNHVVFANRWDSDTDHTGIVKISYNPTTGALDPTAAFDQTPTFLVTGTSTGGNYVNATNFEIDTATHKLYYTDWDNNYSFSPFTPTNAIYVVSDYTAASPTVTKLTDDTQFPSDMSNGIIGNIAVDNAKGLIYFTTLDPVDPGQGHVWYMPIAGGTATKIADLDNLNLGGVPAGLSLDPATQQLYVSTAYYDAPGGGGYPNDPTANANHVLVYQLSADGHAFSSLVASYTLNQLEGATPTGNGAHPGASVWNQLPSLSVTNPSVHAVEQGSAITVQGSFSSSDDGGYYTGATMQITGGTFSSNENSSADDHLFVLDGLTQRTSGTFTATNITVSYDSATEKLILSGYDTIANYNTVMSALGYYATGDNPTNYGNNTTRTVTWTVSDGSQNVPGGQGQNTSTTTITIDAVDDAPVNHLPVGNPGGNEDATFAIMGISISDVDADPASQSMAVVLSVAHGTLTVRTDVAGGIIAANVSGNGTGTVTLTGTQNAINATLADVTGLQYLGGLNFNGADALTVTTSDNGHTGGDPGLTGGPTDEQDQDQLTINVAAVNDAPTANATSVSGSEDPAPRIAITLSGSDVDGDALSFTLASLPGHGQLFAVPAGGSALAVNAVIPASGNSATVYFQPAADYNGPDSFTYTAFDGTLASAAATASITITAVADIADDTVTVNENASGQSLALLANDTFSNPGRAITAITQPLHGTAAINNNGTAGDLTDDFVVYTPAANYTGPDSFTYTVTSGGVSETGTVYVTVAAVNHIPTITSSPSFSVQENHTAVGTVTAVDPDHDAVTFALAGGSDQAFFAIDANTGVLRFLASPDFETPEDSGHNNIYDVVVSVTDTSNASSSQLVHVSVTNVTEVGQVINGGNGNDTLTGTTGNDIISGGNGNDVINAGDGDDCVTGGNGNDTINGGRGNDLLNGNNGNDTLDGASGNNQLFGGNGNDVMRVGNGDNCLDGGNGNDRLTVGTGDNTLSGGNGNDIFVFGPSFGKDTVTDFRHGDRIEFDGGVFANFSAVQAAMHQVGADTVISLGPDHAITLQHVNASSLHASDFLFG